VVVKREDKNRGKNKINELILKNKIKITIVIIITIIN